jgi:hypothetical protein
MRVALPLALLLLCMPMQTTAQGLSVEQRAHEAIEDRVQRVMRDAMRRCWRMPSGEGARHIRVTAEFDLNRDGSLIGEPRLNVQGGGADDPAAREALELARQAVVNCAPYPISSDPELANHYEVWREMSLIFMVP